MPAAWSALPTGSKIRLAVLLDQRLEERHAEHLAFALIDAGGEILVDVVAEEVPVQEARPPCVFMNSSIAASFCASLPKILAMMHSISPR